MRRRTFLASVVLPVGARAQNPKTARIGVLSGLAESDPVTQERLAALRSGLAAAGWREGRNLTLDTRFAPTSDELAHRLVAELLALSPDLLIVQGPGVAAAQKATRSTPIVFVVTPDPVGAGFVETLARPGGNITGFTSTEPSFGAKWIELLKEVAPSLQRIAVMTHNAVRFYRSSFDDAARHFGIELLFRHVDSQAEIETALAELTAQPNSGLILPTDAFTAVLRRPIIDLCLRHKLPMITGNQPFPRDGGLMYYGADIIDVYRRSADYVDRILKGAAVAELPVQQPTTFQMVINLRTAASLGLTVSPTVRALADEVIE
jgi:putative ABC transport system substrate-binding protein